MQPEYNLVEEKWIRVRQGSDVKEVSLRETLINAHNYDGLGNEICTLDVAILRLLLAIVHTVFDRVEANGKPYTDRDEYGVEDCWCELMEKGHFPSEVINAYFDEHMDDFYLFHETRPFYQAPTAKVGTSYDSAKLIGTSLESANKLRLFTVVNGESKMNVSYPQAARWLLHVNGYDDTSAKPRTKGLGSPGAGWLGKLGLVYAQGSNLFETLMLNFAAMKEDNTYWEEAKPTWENAKPKGDERTEIAIPNNQAALLSLQSRRLLLRREEGKVTGFNLLGGDYFDKVNAINEQMTVWGRTADKKKLDIQPRRHDPSRQIWRDFGRLFIPQGNEKMPGIVMWVRHIKENEWIESLKHVSFSIASVVYGDKDFFVTDIIGDSITFDMALLLEDATEHRNHIEKEIERIDNVASDVAYLAKSITFASGGEGGTLENLSKIQLYHEMDQPFRAWLAGFKAKMQAEERDEYILQWQHQARHIAYTLGEQLVAKAGQVAFKGRYHQRNSDKKRYYSSVQAYQFFSWKINSIYPQEK